MARIGARKSRHLALLMLLLFALSIGSCSSRPVDPALDGGGPTRIPADTPTISAAAAESSSSPSSSPGSSSSSSSSSNSSSSDDANVPNSDSIPAAAAAATPAYSVPALLPHVALTLQLAWSGTLLSLRQQLVADLVSATGVSAQRIMLTQLRIWQPVSSARIDARFAITPALHPSAADAQRAASTFLTATAASNAAFAGLPMLQHLGNGTALADPPSAASLLQEVRFGLQLDMAALPGGGLDAFSGMLLAELAPICGVAQRRLHVLSVSAGSVQVAFTVAPRLVTTQLASDDAVRLFVTAAANTTSTLYTGNITARTIAGSVRVGIPGDATQADGDGEGYWTRTRILCAAAGAGAGVFILVLGGVWIYLSEKHAREAKLAAEATLAKNRELAAASRAARESSTSPTPAPQPKHLPILPYDPAFVAARNASLVSALAPAPAPARSASSIELSQVSLRVDTSLASPSAAAARSSSPIRPGGAASLARISNMPVAGASRPPVPGSVSSPVAPLPLRVPALSAVSPSALDSSSTPTLVEYIPTHHRALSNGGSPAAAALGAAATKRTFRIHFAKPPGAPLTARRLAHATQQQPV